MPVFPDAYPRVTDCCGKAYRPILQISAAMMSGPQMVKLPSQTYDWSIFELKAFCVVCDCRNLSAAAQRLGVTQQGLSMMVRRWRAALGDPVYTRSRYGVNPTDLSLSLRRQLERPLLELQQTLDDPNSFDPATSSRVFRLHMSDIGQLVFLPTLSAALEKSAPSVRLDVRQIPWDDVPYALATGAVDLALGSLPMVKGRTFVKKLRREGYVAVMRGAHPFASRTLGLKDYMDAVHLGIDAPSSGHAFIGALLQGRGLCRNVRLTISHYLAAEKILLGSDFLLTVPRIAVSAFHRPADFSVHPVPFPLPDFEISLHWHERASGDQAVQWLKGEVARASQTLA